MASRYESSRRKSPEFCVPDEVWENTSCEDPRKRFVDIFAYRFSSKAIENQ